MHATTKTVQSDEDASILYQTGAMHYKAACHNIKISSVLTSETVLPSSYDSWYRVASLRVSGLVKPPPCNLIEKPAAGRLYPVDAL